MSILSKPFYKLTMTGEQTEGQKKQPLGARSVALPKKDFRVAQKCVQHLKEKKQLMTNTADSFDNI